MTLSKKERRKIPRTPIPEQDPVRRAGNFEEVNLGFTADMARLEAMRCLECKLPKCIDGCPVGVRIDEFLVLVAEGRFAEAAQVVKIDNSLPAICGRVCPQENQCEGACVLARTGDSVAIGALERFVADFERVNGLGTVELPTVSTGKKVAVVGSGPAGLACATDLIKAGHQVTVYEALHELGGVLVYGIPQFRLPKEIVKAEIDGLKQLGVEFVTNAIVGQTTTIDALFDEGHSAVFLGVGAGLPKFTNVEGENLVGVYSANEFLTRVNLMRAYKASSDTPIIGVNGKVVAVFGGGNTAMDAVRTALRLGAGRAVILYRRAEEQMPARVEEIAHAKDEGVEFRLLT
ncbi:MAG: FAD-dependent oxidoreductase, partial [Acidimicrobiia bacterium]|nr:FAD-dependent oxidoreductase [Acidimicrobiia bacterium]